MQSKDYQDYIKEVTGVVVPLETIDKEIKTPKDAEAYVEFISQDTLETPEEKMQAEGAAGLINAPNVLGGLVRTPIADILSKPENVTKEDYIKAIKGQAPSSTEFMVREGAPEMGKIDLPILGEVTGRGTLGFGLDVLSDILPGAALRKIPGIAGKIAKLVNTPIQTGMRKVGKEVYKIPFYPADEAAKETLEQSLKSGIITKKEMEEILPSRQAMGNAEGPNFKSDAGITDRSLSKKLLEKVYKEKEKKQLLFKIAESLGAKVNMGKAMDKFYTYAEELIGQDPRYIPIVDKIKDWAKQYEQLGDIPLSQADGIKSRLSEDIGDAAFDILKKSETGDKLIKAMQKGIDDEIISSANNFKDDLGINIKKSNLKQAALLAGKDELMGPMSGHPVRIRYTPTQTAIATATNLVKNAVPTYGGKAISLLGGSNNIPIWDLLLKEAIRKKYTPMTPEEKLRSEQESE